MSDEELSLRELINKAQQKQGENIERFVEALAQGTVSAKSDNGVFSYSDPVVQLTFSPAEKGYVLEWKNLGTGENEKSTQHYPYERISTRDEARQEFEGILLDYLTAELGLHIVFNFEQLQKILRKLDND